VLERAEPRNGREPLEKRVDERRRREVVA